MCRLFISPNRLSSSPRQSVSAVMMCSSSVLSVSPSLSACTSDCWERVRLCSFQAITTVCAARTAATAVSPRKDVVALGKERSDVTSWS